MIILCASLAACHPAASRGPTVPDAPVVDETLLDRGTDPCDDFYQYACGGWLARTTIPEGRARVTIYDSVMADNAGVLRSIAEDAAAGKSSLPEAREIGDTYAACLAPEDPDAEKVLAEELARIDAATDRKALAAAVARVQMLAGSIGPWTLGAGPLFGVGTDYDLHEPALITVQLDQGGVVLPAEAYADESADGQRLRATYREHVGRMLALCGAPSGADAVVRIETALAHASISEQERRDPARIDHLTSRRDLAAKVPALDWDAYFAALGRPELEVVNLMVPGYYETLNALVAGSKPDELRAYLRWQLLVALGPALPARFAAERQTLLAATTGATAPPARADECIEDLDKGMGDALGKLYVERRFGPAAHRAADALADHIVAAFAADLEVVPWLDAATRAAAREKLARLGRKIGAPATSRSYRGLAVDRRSRLRNHLQLALFNSAYWLRRAGTRPPRDEWLMTPQSLGAYYDVARNEMVFPAALFQPPIFYPQGRMAVTYANMGWVMAHELSHGFDAQGRKYDASGAPRSFWSPAADEAFGERARCVVDQYNGYEVLPGVHLDGNASLTENVADIGGLRLSYEAYVKARGVAASPAAELDADRQFFLAVAQGSCTKVTAAAARGSIAKVHSPMKFAINGPIADLPAFARAFQCKPGAKMAPVKPCQIW